MADHTPISPAVDPGHYPAGMGLMHSMPTFLQIGQRDPRSQHGPPMPPVPEQVMIHPWAADEQPDILSQSQPPQWDGNGPSYPQWTHNPPQY